jgi:hypothetical protein
MKLTQKRLRVVQFLQKQCIIRETHMNRDEIIETMARAICRLAHGTALNREPVKDELIDHRWYMFMPTATAALSSLEAAGMVIVPKEPTEGLLRSMAIRYDHGLGVPGYYDQPMIAKYSVSHEQRIAGTITTMRQLHEEVVGTGFYRAKKD